MSIVICNENCNLHWAWEIIRRRRWIAIPRAAARLAAKKSNKLEKFVRLSLILHVSALTVAFEAFRRCCLCQSSFSFDHSMNFILMYRQTLGGHINMSESLKQKLKMNNISFSVKPTCISKIKAQDLDKIIVENISYGQRRTSLNQIVIFILCILLPIFFSFYPSAN